MEKTNGSAGARSVQPPDVSGAGARGPFRIAAVSEMTSVPEPTLRAWERRYGIPAPDRTASGYRLYGLREVEQVREMRALCEGGMAAGEAARLVRSGAGQHAPIGPSDGDASEAARAGLLDAIDRFDDEALEARTRQLMFLGNTRKLLDEVLAPVLTEIGDRWQAGMLSIAQEHMATQRLGMLMRDLLRLSAGASGNKRVVLGSFADDEHELGLLGLALRLATWGFRPVFLGARTPPAAVRSAVVSTRPALVALSVTLTPSRARAIELVSEYADACGVVPWIVGGAGVGPLTDLVEARGGVVGSGEARELRATLQAALDRPTRSARS
jgi:DNA-binding transcriptional MerR regulator/methylmalonyl-CoA mutase cobalamin-binding subunit